MKKQVIAISTLLFVSFIALTSYEKAETATGSVVVKTTYNGTPMAEVLVGISASAEDRENSTYISEKETDSKGIITFSALNPGTYYLDAAFSSDDSEDSYYAEAEVTVADARVDVTIEMEIDE